MCDESMLNRFAGQNMLPHHTIVLALLFYRFSEKRGATVCANDIGQTMVLLICSNTRSNGAELIDGSTSICPL